MNWRDVITTMGERFVSGNSIPVERAMITRREWDAVLQKLADAAEPADDDASLRRECVDLAAEHFVSVAGCKGWPSSALLAFKLLCNRNALNR